MDTTFIKYIEEIEKLYIHLPKLQRVRVEKWVEKLVNIGSNAVWRKHRNAYTKLLLNMVVSRNLSEPFNALPPEGPLPSYPFHIKPITKDLIGVHETTFWRDLHSRLQEQDARENLINLSGVRHQPSTDMSHLASGKKSTPFGDNPLSREINNLQILIQEQDQKILLLEQQLHEERVKHELTIQRMNYAHRMEIHQLLTGDKSTPSNLFTAPGTANLKKPVHDNLHSSRMKFNGEDPSSVHSHESLFSSSHQTEVLRSSNQRASYPTENLIYTNRLYQSFPSDKFSRMERKDPTPSFSLHDQIPITDFSATLKRGQSPILPSEFHRGNSEWNQKVADESLQSGIYTSLPQRTLFDVSHSSFTREVPPTTTVEESNLNHPAAAVDIVPMKRFATTQATDHPLGIEPNISVISVHKEKAVSFPAGEIPLIEKTSELLINSFEEKIQEQPEPPSKDSSDEEYLNYLDQFQQHIQSF